MTRDDTGAGSPPGRSLGLLAAARRLLATFTEVLHTRAGILFTEMEEETGRIRELLLYELVSLFFLGLGLLLATLFVVMAFWEDHRLAVLAGFTLFYLAIGIGTGLVARHKLKTRPRLFATSLAELGKDRERLDSES